MCKGSAPQPLLCSRVSCNERKWYLVEVRREALEPDSLKLKSQLQLLPTVCPLSSYLTSLNVQSFLICQTGKVTAPTICWGWL